MVSQNPCQAETNKWNAAATGSGDAEMDARATSIGRAGQDRPGEFVVSVSRLFCPSHCCRDCFIHPFSSCTSCSCSLPCESFRIGSWGQLAGNLVTTRLSLLGAFTTITRGLAVKKKASNHAIHHQWLNQWTCSSAKATAISPTRWNNLAIASDHHHFYKAKAL